MERKRTFWEIVFRKAATVVIVLCIIGLLPIVNSSAQVKGPPFITIGTGGMGGLYYPSGVVMAKVFEPIFPGSKINARTTGGSYDNINKIGTKEIEMGISYGPVAILAVRGEGAYAGKPATYLRGLTCIYPDYSQLVVAMDINKLSDLKGKSIGVGSVGSSAYLDIKIKLEVAGLDITKDVKSNPVSFAEAADMLKDGHIAACVQYGKGNATVADILFSKRGKILSLTQDEIKKIMEKNPTYVPVVFPPNTYTGQTEAVHLVSAPNLLLTHKDMPTEVAYHIVKGIFDHLKELREGAKTFNELTLEMALKGMTAPLHPGAEKFFKEKELVK